jgi:hypothetical protein
MERLSSVVGDPFNDPGFRFAPTNAKGVLLLFVRKVGDLNMYVEEVPEEFPDCFVRRQTEHGWKRLAVIGAFHSSALRTRGPELSGCDLVVCWKHDWSDCPLEVIELRTIRLDAGSVPARTGERQRLGGYLMRQPAPMQRVFRRLDEGIRVLAPRYPDQGHQRTEGGWRGIVLYPRAALLRYRLPPHRARVDVQRVHSRPALGER